MFVYAIVPSVEGDSTEDSGVGLFQPAVPTRRDPFVHCHEVLGTIALPMPDVIASPNTHRVYGNTAKHAASYPADTKDADARERWAIDTLSAGLPVLAAVCLGTTAHTYVHKTAGDYWYADIKQLTWSGRRLVQFLSDLYGDRQVELVTYVDT